MQYEGFKIREARRERHMKQRELAARMHVQPSQLSRIEQGHTRTTPAMARLAAGAMNMDPSEFEDTGNRSAPITLNAVEGDLLRAYRQCTEAAQINVLSIMKALARAAPHER